jgi:hypothetical protein
MLSKSGHETEISLIFFSGKTPKKVVETGSGRNSAQALFLQYRKKLH